MQPDVSQLHVNDAFNSYDGANAYDQLLENPQQQAFNPYLHDTAGAGGVTIYNQENTFKQPVWWIFLPSLES